MDSDSLTENPRIKIAVLGGGCGAMAAAFYLSSTEELRARYEVTVYQQGWQLGGKGATGRDRRTGYGDRVYEHGLHMWLGWYHNAFNLIQQVFGEWEKKPDNPYQQWSDAFEVQRSYAMQQDVPLPNGDVRWRTRLIKMPRLPGTPGQGAGVLRTINLLEPLIASIESILKDSDLFEHQLTGLDEILAQETAFIERARDLGIETHPGENPLLFPARCAALKLQVFDTSAGEERDELLEMVAHLLCGFQRWLHSPMALDVAGRGDTARWYWQFLDFSTAIGLGMARDVIPNGVASINHLNFHEWLVQNGAGEGTRWSAYTRAIYDLAFAFDLGIADLQHASYEAGSALMVYLRVALGYKDAPMFRMQAGMGDTIFSPIYEVLAKQRGVKFEFFKRVRNLSLTPDQTEIASIELDIQAVVKAGPAAYEPLYDLTFADGKTLPVWPDQPFWDQLEGGDGLSEQTGGPGDNFNSAWCQIRSGEQSLKRNTDFDLVVLGISVGGVKLITQELCEASPAWEAMVNNLATVETQAIQLWMNPTLEDLGWRDGMTVQTTYVEPIDTWAVMSDVLKRETWETGDGPKSLHYFCGPKMCPREAPISDPNYPSDADDAVKTESLSWLDLHLGHLWPEGVDANGALDYSLLHDPEVRTGAARFDGQYWRANIDPSDRYVNSQPGTSVYRLRPDQSGFANLFLAGDWTVSSVNGGCVEAAVESGMAASRGICGVPRDIPNFPD